MYVENTDPDGRRRDANQRPELSRGSVEYAADLPIFQVTSVSIHACMCYSQTPWSCHLVLHSTLVIV